MAQAGTQTSPEAVKGHFSIGAGGVKEDIRLSPKSGRKERSSRSSKRAMSPSALQSAQPPTTSQRPVQREIRSAESCLHKLIMISLSCIMDKGWKVSYIV